jgi:hypothetical protein
VKEYFGAPAHLKQSRDCSSGPLGEAQARCDAIQAEFRAGKMERKSIRRDPPAQLPPLVPTDDQLLQRLAEELEFARRMIEAMGDALSADITVITRHAVALQSIDIAGQMLGHVATVVRSRDRNDAVERIGMGDLKARLTRKSLG